MPTIEVVAVLLEDECLRSFLSNGVNRQDDSVLPLFDGNVKLHSLAGLELPCQEPMTIGCLFVVNVKYLHTELNSAEALFIVRNAQISQPQLIV